jgi:hypothetical protein
MLTARPEPSRDVDDGGKGLTLPLLTEPIGSAFCPGRPDEEI